MRGLRGAWLGLGALAYFTASLAWLAASRPLGRSDFGAGSVYNTSPDGASLAYRYLQVRAGNARVLSRPLEVGEVEGRAVVFRLRPQEPRFQQDQAKRPQPAGRRTLLSRSEEEWVRGGGRLVLALAESRGPARVESAGGSSALAAQKVFPLWDEVQALYPAPPRVLTGDVLEEAHAIFLSADRPLLARCPLGQGELFLLAAPELLENGRLGQGDHLALLEALAGPGRPAYFDEQVHGLGGQPGLLELLLRLGFGPLLLLLAASGAAAFWRGRRRLGPAVDDYQETRSDAVDLLDSLGQLYDRSLRRDEAALLYREALAREVALRSGLRGEALDARVASLAGPRIRTPDRSAPDLSAAAFSRALESVNHGFRRFHA